LGGRADVEQADDDSEQVWGLCWDTWGVYSEQSTSE